MDMNHIRTVAAIYEEGSITAAAAREGKTVQAVSVALSRLEQELGRKLFDRGSRAARPNSFGEAFYRKSLPVMESFAECEAMMDAARGEVEA